MSTLNVGNITDGTNSVDTEKLSKGTAAAWVNFNGEGTVAIRDSFNVSSITDNGLGRYTANFSSPMANANYAYSLYGSRQPEGSSTYDPTVSLPTVNSISIQTYNDSTYQDHELVSLVVFSN